MGTKEMKKYIALKKVGYIFNLLELEANKKNDL